jgi:hypothetical protein
MSYPDTPAPVNPQTPGALGFGGAAPPPRPHGPLPVPPPQYAPREISRRRIALAVATAASLAAFIAGVSGVYVGSRLTGNPNQQDGPHAVPTSPPSSPPAPAGQVHAATVDLCTRFAAGYRAMPKPQNSSFDVVPTANYIADALRDNPTADPGIRDAVVNSLSGLRAHIALASGADTAGAIQIPQGWTAEAANTADQHVWDLCRAYEG